MSRSRRPKADPNRHVSFRLPPDLIAALDDAAAKSYLSKTKVLELTLRAGLKRFRSPKEAMTAISETPDPNQLDMFE